MGLEGFNRRRGIPKPSPDAVGWQSRLAQSQASWPTSKIEALRHYERVASDLCSNGTVERLVRFLLTQCVSKEAWDRQQPIAYPSNRRLADELGKDVRTVRRLLKAAEDAGLIAMRYSPNGKRGVVRDRRGDPVDVYGIDLSPIALRAAEFAELAEAKAVAQDQRRKLCRDLSVEAKRCESLLVTIDEYFPSLDTGTLLARFLEHRDGDAVASRLAALQQLRADLETCYAEAASGRSERQRTSTPSQEDIPDPTNTERDSDIDSYCSPGGAGRPAAAETRSLIQLHHNLERRVPQPSAPMSPQFLATALPTLSQLCGQSDGLIRSERDLLAGADRGRRALRIRDPIWNSALRILGPVRSALSVGIILEKSARDLIEHPDRYLCGMVRKAKGGALDLKTSLEALGDLTKARPGATSMGGP